MREQPQFMDREKISHNLAKLKKGGLNFEIAIDADKAMEYKAKGDVDVADIIDSDKVFHDMQKGLLASEEKMQELFGSTNSAEVSKIIIDEGEIQLTAEYRAKLREEKRNRVADIIAKNAIDPTTKIPHPRQRIENALAESKVKIDEFKSAEDQIQDIVKKLQPILPIRFETKNVSMRIPATVAGKCYPVIMQFGKPKEESWNQDGSLSCVLELPAGIVGELMDKLNNITHGSAEIKIE
ncbi:ribosome assembly factor SBDS [Nanoarchaeota archaeon]